MRALVITKGHPFERGPFYTMFDQIEGIEWTHVEHPAAIAAFEPDYASDYDAFVFYDMPGIRFRPGGPEFFQPPDRFKANLERAADRGAGFVFLHHAIAGWPAWKEYGDLIGGRFLYLPEMLRGVERLDSGYRHGVTHEVSCIGAHPVTDGLPRSFSITDELYLYEVFEEDVTPLLRSGHTFDAASFYSAAKVVREGKMFDNSGWRHPPGSNLIGWTKQVKASRLVYLQCGDDPVAYGNSHYRKLIENAVRWTAANSRGRSR
jgi:type 1 glutamine amidotransferase